MSRRLAVYCPWLPPIRGGLPDHTLVLARALAARGVDVVVLGRWGDPALLAPIPCRVGVTHWPGRTGLVAACRATGAQSLLIQYVPFLFARRGLAPYLIPTAVALRKARIRLGVFVHEPWVPPTRLVWRFTGPLMRQQLLALVRRADVVFGAVPKFLDLVRPAVRPGVPVELVSVGATLPVTAHDHGEARAALGIAPGDVVVAVFSPGAVGALPSWIERAAQALDGAPGVQWLIFGHASDHLPASFPPAARVRRLGVLDAPDASRALRAADLALAPFVDGLTLRRSSALAALAHGLPLVSSRGPLFDPFAGEAALCLESADAFAEAVRDLVADRDARAALARACQEFYRTHASMEVLARVVAFRLCEDG